LENFNTKDLNSHGKSAPTWRLWCSTRGLLNPAEKPLKTACQLMHPELHVRFVGQAGRQAVGGQLLGLLTVQLRNGKLDKRSADTAWTLNMLSPH
jgi:hypothetical protein